MLRILVALLLLALCGCGGSSSTQAPPPADSGLVVNSTADTATPSAGQTTLRSAIERAGPGDVITFAPALDGATISLTLVGNAHSLLKAEVYAGGPPKFQGYFDRDYGKSAIYTSKDLTLDASALRSGVTIAWAGTEPARVLGVYGNLTLRNITITGGHSKAEPLADTAQPFTLARGGGIAVWGTATLEHSVVTGNQITGDDQATRDRGAYGGGIYANGILLSDSVVSGNTARGYGAAGGGIYSVGGADQTDGTGHPTSLERCAVTGNRVTAQHAYGGGIFTLSGGPNNLATMTVRNCTVARNVVEDRADLPDVGQYYYRGGGIYMGGGSLRVFSSTVIENEVSGTPAIFSGKPNVGGGGLAATIGDAHVVENMVLQHSTVTGNRMNGAASDIFSGSLLNFYSFGHNRFGHIDFVHMLVPVPDWYNLSRKRYPKVGDADGVALADVVQVSAAERHPRALSAGVDAGQPAVMWYPPAGSAVDAIALASYPVEVVDAQYAGFGLPSDNFLNAVLARLRTSYSAQLGSDFGLSYGDMTGTTWYGPARTWPSNTQNAAWIAFWKKLDTDIAGRLGTAGLNDDFWGGFRSGAVGNVVLSVGRSSYTVSRSSEDQRRASRPSASPGDIGAIEK